MPVISFRSSRFGAKDCSGAKAITCSSGNHTNPSLLSVHDELLQSGKEAPVTLSFLNEVIGAVSILRHHFD